MPYTIRLRALGNAVCPQVGYVIGRAVRAMLERCPE